MKIDIKITTKQYDEKNNEDIISLDVIGELYEKNNKKCIMYKEEDTTNTIIINNDNKEINLKKFGKTKSSMNFCKEKIDFVKYNTSYGLFDMSIYTTNINIQEDSNKLLINICYDIDIKDLFKGRNVLDIEIKKSEF